MRIRRLTGLGLAVALSLMATIALGHHGAVTGSADCTSWQVTATLFETSTDRRIVVETTIAGTTGLDATGFEADKGGTVVWSASGASPVTGTVTLSIFNPAGELENQSALTVSSPADCTTETETPAPTPVAETPAPTPEPTTPDTAMAPR